MLIGLEKKNFKVSLFPPFPLLKKISQKRPQEKKKKRGFQKRGFIKRNLVGFFSFLAIIFSVRELVFIFSSSKAMAW